MLVQAEELAVIFTENSLIKLSQNYYQQTGYGPLPLIVH